LSIALTDGGAESFIAVGTSRVYGLPVDAQTRCVHWSGPHDVVAIGFRCCSLIYPCRECHDAVADHAAELWPAEERDSCVILCGECTALFSIGVYLATDACPVCDASFNPGCRLHRHLYFA
jgi:uncharacterized CHY-type Zn-finger protein